MDTEKLTVPDVLPLVEEYYRKPGNGVGGNLHIVLDDYNIQNRHIEFCLKEAQVAGDEDGIRIARLLLKMSKSQRLKICKTHRGGQL